MKALIEIDEKTFKALREFVVINTGRSNGKTIIYKCLKAISKGTPIPDNAKNIDALMTVFPKADIRFEGRNNELFGYIEFAGDWLDAPYKGGE